MLTKLGHPVLTKLCVFTLQLPTKDEPRIIYGAEYPPKASDVAKMDANATFKHVVKHIGHDRIDFIDLIPESPVTTPSSHISRASLRAMVTPRRISNWYARIVKRVEEVFVVTDTTPVIYLAGELCNNVWKSDTKEDRFFFKRTISGTLGVHLYKIKFDGGRGCDVIVMEGHPHPSAAMVSGNDPMAVTADKLALSVVKTLTSPGVLFTEEAIFSHLDSNTKLRLQRMKEFMKKCKIDAAATGWWPKALRHWRHGAFDSKAFWHQCVMLLEMFVHDKDVLTCVMRMHVFNRLVTADGMQYFEQWYGLLGSKRFTTFMSNSVASALVGDNSTVFQQLLMDWYERLKKKRFATFMCGGVASALAGDNSTVFQQLLMEWYDRLDAKRFTTFMCGGVASALAGDNSTVFQQLLMEWYDRLDDQKRFATFMCGGVASALVGDNSTVFQQLLIKWYDRLGEKLFATFMSDSVASALAGDNSTVFQQRLFSLFQLMGSVDLIKVMKGGVAARILESQFYQDLIKVYSELTVLQRTMFCKFFALNVAAIRDLGPTMFWATVREICGQASSITGKEAMVKMKQKRELHGRHIAKRHKQK